MALIHHCHTFGGMVVPGRCSFVLLSDPLRDCVDEFTEAIDENACGHKDLALSSIPKGLTKVELH